MMLRKLLSAVIIFAILGLLSCIQIKALQIRDKAEQLYSEKKFAETIPLLENAVTELEKEGGPEHEYVGESMYNLGRLYTYVVEDYSRAEELIERSLIIREKALGPEHPKTIENISFMGFLSQSMGKYTKAEASLKKALTLREKVLGPDHPDTADTQIYLGSLYLTLGDYAKAESLLQKAENNEENQVSIKYPSPADSLVKLGNLYATLCDFARAESFYERALVIREKALGPEHPFVAECLSLLSGLYEALGEYAKAESFYKRSLAILEKALGPDHTGVASNLNALASLYLTLGDFAKAEQLSRRSLAIREKTLGPDHTAVASSLNSLAVTYHWLGDFTKAEQFYKRSLVIREKALGPEHPTVASSLNSLAVIYHALGNFSKAEQVNKCSLSIREKALGPEHPAVATSLDSLALTYHALGDFSKAEQLNKRSLSIREKALGPEHPAVATSLNGLALTYAMLGDYARAEQLHQRAMDIREESFGPEHTAVAASINNIALIYEMLGDYTKAEAFHQRALATWEKALGPEHTNVAASQFNLAMVYTLTGDYTRAEPFLKRSLTIWEKALGPEHMLVATGLNGLAGLHYLQGDYTKVEPLCQRSLTIIEKALGPEHPDNIYVLHRLSWLSYKLGNFAKAKDLCERALMLVGANRLKERHLWRIQFVYSKVLDKLGIVNAAIFYGKNAVNNIQCLRAGISVMEKDLQQSFLVKKEEVYKHLTELLIGQGRLPEAQQVLAMLKEEEYFDFIRRDIVRGDTLSTRAVFTPAEEPWVERYRGINDQLAATGQEVEELSRKKKFGLSQLEKTRLREAREDLKLAKKAFDRFLADLKTELQKVTRVRAMEIGEKNLDKLKAMQGTLRELGKGVVLVHYLILEDKLHIILTTSRVQLVRNSPISAAELNRKIFTFRQSLQDIGLDPHNSSRDLYNILFGPISNDLKQSNAKTLMLSMDGALRYLPAAALNDGKRYMAEEYRIVMFTEAAQTKITTRPKDQWRLAGLGVSKGITGFAPLPAVASELDSIVRSGPDDPDGVLPGVIYLDEAFTGDTMLGVLDENFQVLHIASHFVFKPGTERDSFLLLGDGSTLSLAQINDEDLDFNHIDLLTLSACETAMGGANADGREVDGFGSLAQRQGAKAVLATLWPVEDESVGFFMQNMYGLRQEKGLTKAEAVHMAQIEFIQSKKYSHPFFWAPYILMGNWL